MKILTWNIQATKGCDDRYDLNRITNHIKSFGDLDLVCLQEVSRNIPDLNANDQPALIAEAFPDYEMIWGPGFSASAGAQGRYEFGNLTLIKPQLFRNSSLHVLPAPPVETLQMPRTMLEVVLNAGDRNIAVFNTHLAFHAESERIAQVVALTNLRDQKIAKYAVAERRDAIGPYQYANACDSVILCGDLNIDSDSDVFKKHIADKQWFDCWSVYAQSDATAQRQPTCGCFDHLQWPQGPHVRDYFLATKNISTRTTKVDVDTQTNASDHQPVLLELDL